LLSGVFGEFPLIRIVNIIVNITISGIRFGLRRSGDTKAELGLLRRLERLEGEEESKR